MELLRATNFFSQKNKNKSRIVYTVWRSQSVDGFWLLWWLSPNFSCLHFFLSKLFYFWFFLQFFCHPRLEYLFADLSRVYLVLFFASLPKKSWFVTLCQKRKVPMVPDETWRDSRIHQYVSILPFGEDSEKAANRKVQCILKIVKIKLLGRCE